MVFRPFVPPAGAGGRAEDVASFITLRKNGSRAADPASEWTPGVTFCRRRGADPLRPGEACLVCRREG